MQGQYWRVRDNEREANEDRKDINKRDKGKCQDRKRDTDSSQKIDWERREERRGGVRSCVQNKGEGQRNGGERGYR